MSARAMATHDNATAPKAAMFGPTLRVNRPGDSYEHEADRAADDVMSARTTGAAWSLSRIKMHAPVQRDASSAASPAVAPQPVHDVLRGAGHALDGGTRSVMESRFGHDFGSVRIYNDGVAASSARSIAANAYTVGNKVVFNRGKYAPGSAAGDKLLAHELAHVVQQRGTDGILQRSPVDDSSQPPAGTVKGYQYTLDGKPVTLTEEQYKAEVARQAHNLGVDFKRISGIAEVYRDNERDFINNIHGSHWYSVGSISDLMGSADLPDESIWSRPSPSIAVGTTALQRGDLALAARMLPVAEQALKSSIHQWNTYMTATIGGAETTLTVLETTRDVSFSIAIGTAAVVLLPVVAAGAATAAAGVGATGAGATVLAGAGTLATITTGGAVVGGVARGGTSALGQVLAGDKVSGSQVWKDTKEGARHGAVDAATGVVTAGVGKALGPGKSLVSKAFNAGVSGAAGGGVGSAADAALQGKSAKDIVVATGKGVAGGFVGGTIGGAGQHLLGEGGAARAVTGVVGGAAGGGTGALLSDKKGKEALTDVITGGLAGGIAASGSPQHEQTPVGNAPAEHQTVPQSSAIEPTAPVAETARSQSATQHVDADAPVSSHPDTQAAKATAPASPLPEAQAAPVKAAPPEHEAVPSHSAEEHTQAASDKDLQAAKANAKAVKKAAARLKKEALRLEQEKLQAAQTEDHALEEPDVHEAQQKRGQSKQASKRRETDRAYATRGIKEVPGSRAARRVKEMASAAAEGEYVNRSPKNKSRLLREFKAAVKGADARQLPKIKNKMTGDFDEAVRTPANRRVGDPQAKHVAGLTGELFDLPTGRSSYAQPDYSVQIETPQGGRVRAHVNLKAHNLMEITPAQARGIAGSVLTQARNNAFHLPANEPIIISFAETPPRELQNIIRDRLLVNGSPIIEVRFGSATHRR